MERCDFYITKQQNEQLKKLSYITGLAKAEIIRRAIDYYLKEKENEKNGKTQI